MYDHSIDKLSLRWIDHALPLRTTYFRDLCEHLTPYIVHQWNCYLNRIDVRNVAYGTTTMHPYQLDLRENRTRELWHQHIRQSNTEDEIPPLRLSGDREILCLCSHDGMQLWFFNPNFVPGIADANPFLTMDESELI